jgi:hypothetical protein
MVRNFKNFKAFTFAVKKLEALPILVEFAYVICKFVEFAYVSREKFLGYAYVSPENFFMTPPPPPPPNVDGFATSLESGDGFMHFAQINGHQGLLIS